MGRRGGHYYYVDVEGRDSKGNRATRRERRVRWEAASGVVDHFFDDEPVPGTQGLPIDLLRQVEPFPTQEVVPYDTAFLSGHVVEHYKVVLIDAAKQSQEQMHAALMRLCAQQVPGDTQRNLQIHPAFSGRTFKHVLVPLWLLSYNYGARAFQVVVNGYTGKIAGRYPYSVWKIVLLVLLAIVGVGDPRDVEFEVTLNTWLLFCLTEAVLCLTPGPACCWSCRWRSRAGLRRALAPASASSRRTGSISRSRRRASARCCSRPPSCSRSSSGPARRI